MYVEENTHGTAGLIVSAISADETYDLSQLQREGVFDPLLRGGNIQSSVQGVRRQGKSIRHQIFFTELRGAGIRPPLVNKHLPWPMPRLPRWISQFENRY